MAPLVDIAALRYRYPEAATAALNAVDLAIEGGLTVVGGPSGGGKSTLLRLLNGLVPHLYGGSIGGRAIVDGHDVLRTPARRLATSVGFVFQDAERQAVHATVERDIAFGLENVGVAPAAMRGRVADVMDALGIAHLGGRTIATLSGGERQRVAVAGALVLRPRLLVLDEPFSQLDDAGARALLDLCTELTRDGTAVVVAEHRLDELLPTADALVTVATGHLTGPAAPASLAASLDSAPQVVRLSRQCGWTPPLLDAAQLRLPPATQHAATPFVAVRSRAAEVAWSLENVTAGYASLLRDVTVEGRRGEVVAVMGTNGSGKTTLLRVIAGLIAPRAGTVHRRDGRVAYLPQNPAALLHRQTVAAEVEWTLRRSPVRSDDTDHADLMGALGMPAIAGCDPRDLSSGQRQRGAIAAVVCGWPAAVLLDEPTRGMDGAARHGLAAAVHTLAARGASVVVATHDSDLAASLAHRVLVIDGGTVRDRGTPEDALSGAGPHATQLGRLFASPGPVTVEAVATLFAGADAGAGARVSAGART
jgi:energy-coupling factor transporter ATP-binding protein EcfA2